MARCVMVAQVLTNSTCSLLGFWKIKCHMVRTGWMPVFLQQSKMWPWVFSYSDYGAGSSVHCVWGPSARRLHTWPDLTQSEVELWSSPIPPGEDEEMLTFPSCFLVSLPPSLDVLSHGNVSVCYMVGSCGFCFLLASLCLYRALVKTPCSSNFCHKCLTALRTIEPDCGSIH